MADRSPARDSYDVELSLANTDRIQELDGLALIKMTYALDPASGALSPGEALPMVGDIKSKTCVPPIPPHSDYWPEKSYADVAFTGSAFAPDATPTARVGVEVEVAGRSKRLLVQGRRAITVKGGKAHIAEPEPFTEQPLGIEWAYGGIDRRVPFNRNDPEQRQLVAIEADWPGLAPRNPWGRGYICDAGDLEGYEMPRQEDPQDLLTPDRLIVNPTLWYLAPMPAHIGWMPVNCFPRNMFLAFDNMPWFPAPDDASLPEVAMGHLPPGWHQHLKQHDIGKMPHWRFRQESAPGFYFSPDELASAPVRVVGMHPAAREISFTLPPPPVVEMKFDTARDKVAAKLTAVEILPDQEKVAMTYAARIRAPRPFVVGIHRDIPLAVSINGDAAVRFDTPETVDDQLERAKAAQKEPMQ